MGSLVPTSPSSRDDIAESWHRSELSGLAPDRALDRLTQTEVDCQSRLLVAATPVLNDAAERLAGTRFCLVLADRDAQIVDRRFGDPGLEPVLEMVSAVPGTRFDEATTGTNSIATTHEVRRGVAVVGAEHYLDAMKGFCCYGHPIIHPVTRRLEGVLDITGHVDDANDLLGPFLVNAVRAIEQRLLQGSRIAQQHLLAAYQVATTHAVSPVLVMGEGVLLANSYATEQLSPTDYVVIKALAGDPVPTRTAKARISLSSGHAADVVVEPVPLSGEGAVITLRPTEAPRVTAVARPRKQRSRIHTVDAQSLATWRQARVPVLVCGEPGSGRTSLARELLGHESVTVLDALDLPSLGEATWCAQLSLLVAGEGSLLIENVHALPTSAAIRVRHLLARPSESHQVATSAPIDSLAGEHAALASVFLTRLDLPPLRRVRESIPSLAAEMLEAARPGRGLRLSPRLLEVLVRQPWPANLAELQRVIGHLASSRRAGTLEPGDLPNGYTERAAHRVLTPLEQSEYETIVTALRTTRGNKVAAAKHLGIARGTLYSRMRRLHISG